LEEWKPVSELLDPLMRAARDKLADRSDRWCPIYANALDELAFEPLRFRPLLHAPAKGTAEAESIDRLQAEADLLIRLTRPVTANPDRHLALQPLEEIKQLIRGETAEMSVHQVRNFRLFDPEQRRNLPLWQLLAFQDLIDMKPDSCPCKQLVAFLKPQVREDVAGAFLEFGFCLVGIPHVSPAPLLALRIGQSSLLYVVIGEFL